MNLTLSEPQHRKRGPVSFAVFIVLAILLVGLIGLIVLGPRMPGKETAQQFGVSNSLLVFKAPPNSPIASEPKPPPAIQAQAETAKPSTVTPVRSRQYRIAQGDTLGTIARRFHVPVQAIEEANPGVKPNRLKVGQLIHIPAIVTSASNPSALARR